MTTAPEPELTGAGLVALATARLVKPPAAPPRRRIPSLYADPASWAVLEAVDDLLAGGPDEVRADPATTAVVLVGTYATTDTMTAIARAVPGGRLSPLRFAGASAGGPISLACLVHGLRGPTLMVTEDPVHGCPVARTVARHWLRTGAARHVVAGVHTHDPVEGHQVRCTVLGAGR